MKSPNHDINSQSKSKPWSLSGHRNDGRKKQTMLRWPARTCQMPAKTIVLIGLAGVAHIRLFRQQRDN